MLSDLVLWMFVVYSGIAVGAGLYELRVNVPRWFTPGRGSARSVKVDAITADDSGRRFWVYTTTAPLTLLTVVSCVIAWNPATARERWWLAGAAAMLVARRAQSSFAVAEQAEGSAQRPHCGATVATPELLQYMKGLGAGAFPNGCS